MDNYNQEPNEIQNDINLPAIDWKKTNQFPLIFNNFQNTKKYERVQSQQRDRNFSNNNENKEGNPMKLSTTSFSSQKPDNYSKFNQNDVWQMKKKDLNDLQNNMQPLNRKINTLEMKFPKDIFSLKAFKKNT